MGAGTYDPNDSSCANKYFFSFTLDLQRDPRWFMVQNL